jgi:threonine/homoserine/homoserine lactone efflux protein
VSEYLLVGIGFSFAAAVQPGPLQAFLLSLTAAQGWKRTLPAACSPLLSDGPIALVVLLLLRQVPAGFERGVQAAGGVLLLYLATVAFLDWRKQRQGRAMTPRSAPRTLVQAAGVNLLNPNPYLGWSLVLGPLLLKAWHETPLDAVALIVAFYGTMVASLAAIIVVFGTVRSLGPRIMRVVLLLSALTLFALGVYQLCAGARGLTDL